MSDSAPEDTIRVLREYIAELEADNKNILSNYAVLEATIAELEGAASRFGALKPPPARGLEEFAKLLESNPDADMRAIPAQWLLKERGVSAELADQLDAANEHIAELEAKNKALIDANVEVANINAGLLVEVEALREVARAVVEDWLSEPAGVEGRWEAINALAALLEEKDA